MTDLSQLMGVMTKTIKTRGIYGYQATHQRNMDKCDQSPENLESALAFHYPSSDYLPSDGADCAIRL
jgi:hypothetical protein